MTYQLKRMNMETHNSMQMHKNDKAQFQQTRLNLIQKVQLKYAADEEQAQILVRRYRNTYAGQFSR